MTNTSFGTDETWLTSSTAPGVRRAKLITLPESSARASCIAQVNIFVINLLCLKAQQS